MIGSPRRLDASTPRRLDASTPRRLDADELDEADRVRRRYRDRMIIVLA
jgi:hypothetical protein